MRRDRPAGPRPGELWVSFQIDLEAALSGPADLVFREMAHPLGGDEAAGMLKNRRRAVMSLTSSVLGTARETIAGR